MADESLLGLLLRAHAETAAQEQGERYVFDNISASAFYGQAKQSIECAIRQIGFAEMHVARQGERKGKTE
jgi:hypothetical protein